RRSLPAHRSGRVPDAGRATPVHNGRSGRSQRDHGGRDVDAAVDGEDVGSRRHRDGQGGFADGRGCIQMSEKLRELRHRLQEIDDLRAVYNLLNWDQQTHMPVGGAEARGRESALVARLEHEKFTDPEMGRLLDSLVHLEQERDYDDDDASLVRVTRRLYEHATRFPTAFWSHLFEHSSRTYEAWARARAEGDFSLVREHLEVTLELSLELAEFNRPWEHVMDGLTWDREYGTTASQVRRLFGELVDGIVPLVKEIAERPAPDDSFLRATWPRQEQLAFAADVVRDLGY